MADYKFIHIEDRAPIPAKLRNTFVIQGDGWDDYSSQVRFDLHHFDGRGIRTDYGKLKILEKTPYGSSTIVKSRTKPPASFAELPDTYISLGQGEEYYERLGREFGTAEAVEVLRALRDIALMPALAADFETHPPFRNGMMRTNGAQRSIRFGATWVRGEEAHVEPAFTYSKLIGGDIPTTSRFDLDPTDKLPGRIAAIIGRNAVGKTFFLSQLAADLSQIDRISEERLTLKEQRFPDGRPVFARIIAVSFSAFDRFRRPEATPYSSYVYCGIRDEKGAFSQRSLTRSYNANRSRVRGLQRESEWVEHIFEILGDEQGLTADRLRREISDETEGEAGSDRLLDELSSGQAILVHFVTAVLAWIRPDSLVLFDEPETHLHPNAVASLFVVLTHILRQFQSYAIVATHSPVVLQEIPAKRVVQFVRDGDTTVGDLLEIESFGESVTELTRHVFETFEVESLYKAALRQLSQKMSAEEVLTLFPRGLSMAAQSFLIGLYAGRDAG
ncbi:AAA family ATPase [Sphingomonas sp. Leaf28]|uniref:AAA family ATPase n=1 Tax=Sphingomonas sp. Leaf28 TaxID=1735695 RepID=UPI000B2183B8|nr:AAA family ATPase [Sphingomonas sp. Leaf28]